MRAFSEAWPDSEFVQQAAAQLPWYHQELGAGCAFVGKQVLLDVGGDEFFIDLLFYHLKLRCYVVIELKAGKFKPEHLGQLGFYLTAVDAQLKHPQDGPTIGLLRCKTKVVAEYALRDNARPIGSADNRLLAFFRCQQLGAANLYSRVFCRSRP